MAAGFFAAVCVVAQAYVLSDVVDRVFQKKQTLTDVTALLGALLMLAFLRAVIIWISDVLAQRSASALKSSLRQQLTQQIFALGPAYTQAKAAANSSTPPLKAWKSSTNISPLINPRGCWPCWCPSSYSS